MPLATPLFTSLVRINRSALIALAGALVAAGLGWPAHQSTSAVSMPMWHKAGKDGLQCVSCHTPSGREIVAGPFDLADIERRASKHLPSADVAELGKEISAARGIGSLAVSTRPLISKPLFKGATPADRDWAFGQSFDSIDCLLGSGSIKDANTARAALKRLCAVPLQDLRVGIDINPISRDPYRPLDGMALADWIPDVGLPASGTEALMAWNQADGKDLDALQSELNSACGEPKSAFDELSREKRIALMDLELGGGQVHPVKLTRTMAEDPIWQVANFARSVGVTTASQLGMTPDQIKTAGVDRYAPLDFNPMALSWMWSSWTTDPTLGHISGNRKARNGTYLAQSFWLAGPYPFHAVYFAARHPAEQYLVGDPNAALQPEFNSFVNDGALEKFGPPPGLRRLTFKAVCADLYRMDAYILLDDLAQGKKLSSPVAANQQLRNLLDYACDKSTPPDIAALNEKLTASLKPLIQEQIRPKKTAH